MTAYLVIGLLLVMALLYLIWRPQPKAAPSVTAKPVAFLLGPENEPDSWHDVRFKYTVEQKAGARVFHLRNDFEGKELGFDVEVEGQIRTALGHDSRGKVQIDSEKLKGLEIRFVRAGENSDRFIQVLDRLYQTKVGRPHMVESFRFDAIPLEGEENGLAKVKLFGNSNGAEAEYFELFLNIDFREGWAELAEKDPDYRGPMIKALSTD